MTSLRRKLLAWLLPVALLLLAGSALAAYLIALRTASQAYDRVLLEAAADIGDQVQLQDGALVIELTPVVRKILLSDRYDHLYYLVLGPNGEFVGGSPGLPGRLGEATADGAFFDTAFNGEELHAVAVAMHKAGADLRVIVAESLVKRNALIREIWLGMLVPELLLLALAVALLLMGVRHGLAPLAGLITELSYRSHLDLSAVDESHAPAEAQPLVTEINRLLQRLDASQQAQRAFISNAAHQIRTPVAALQAQVELALRQQDRDQMAENLGQVLAAVKRTVHVSNRLLSLARSEPGSAAESQFGPVDLHGVAQEVGEAWIARAIAKDIDLGFELEHATIEGSRPLLHELLANLVDNAILYTPAGGRVTVRVRGDDGVTLEVEDNGPGIAADEQGRIFDRFYRPAGSPEGGCGLGLAIVGEIARAHRADVTIRQPAQGTGSVFCVRFRRAPAPLD